MMATEVGSTHPTTMLSCFDYELSLLRIGEFNEKLPVHTKWLDGWKYHYYQLTTGKIYISPVLKKTRLAWSFPIMC